ncbi:MAG: hypothetical protein LAP13_16635, partial [Acidobacteriia bacterium]|nr:hypothetical protein [Terriglobia bacterium]
LKLGRAYYAYATAHAALGAIAQIAGLYILLAAGTNIVPSRFRPDQRRECDERMGRDAGALGA